MDKTIYIFGMGIYKGLFVNLIYIYICLMTFILTLWGFVSN